MSNDFFNATSVPGSGASLSSATIRAEFLAIAAGFDKMPTLTANGNKAVVVNSGGTGLTVTAAALTLAVALITAGVGAITLTSSAATNVTLPTTGTLATLAGAEELTNKTLTTSVGKGTWTASGTWTLPAVTLGGAVALNAGLTGNSSADITINTNKFTVAASTGNTVIAGTLAVTDTATFAKSVAGQYRVSMTNSNAGTTAHAAFVTSNGTAESVFGTNGTGFTTAGALEANDAFIYSDNHVTLVAGAVAKVIKFAAGGSTEIARISSTGFSTTKSVAGNFRGVVITNANAGTTAGSVLILSNGTAESVFGTNGTGFTTSGALEANDAYIYSDNHVTFMAGGASKVIKFAAGGSTEIARISSTGYSTTKSVAGSFRSIVATNANAGTTAGVVFALSNGTNEGTFGITGTGFTTSGAFEAQDVYTYSDTHITLMAGGGSSVIKFASGGSTEVARFTVQKFLKASSSGTYTSSTSTQHELYKATDDNTPAARITHAGATSTNQFGLVIRLAGDPNDTTRYYWQALGNATERATLRSNGGLANFSANNVNLSDLRVKPDFVSFAENDPKYGAPTISALWDAHKRMRGVWGVFKYDDQDHDDWNFGYTAQGVRTAFAGVADCLVDLWSETDERMLLAVYAEDLKNITGAIVTELQFGFEDLRGRVATLEAENAELRSMLKRAA